MQEIILILAGGALQSFITIFVLKNDIKWIKLTLVRHDKEISNLREHHARIISLRNA
jgi:hypothetical protein